MRTDVFHKTTQTAMHLSAYPVYQPVSSNPRTKRCRKTKNGVNVPQGRSNRCANLQLRLSKYAHWTSYSQSANRTWSDNQNKYENLTKKDQGPDQGQCIGYKGEGRGGRANALPGTIFQLSRAVVQRADIAITD